MAVYTFDGNATETVQLNGITYAKIATTDCNLHDVIKAVHTAPDGSTIEITPDYMTVEDDVSIDGVIGQIIVASMMGYTVPVILKKGRELWAYAQPGFGYFSLVEFADTETEPEPASPGRKYLLYRMFPDIIARVLVGKGGGTTATRLLSSDGYVLQDSNGLYLIPKEG